MSAVGTTGKRAGARRASPGRPRATLLALALGITCCVIAWGYLVFTAIDFGAAARNGESDAWWLLGGCSVGAVACLFVGLMLIARLSRALGVTGEPDRPVGGRRAAR